MSRSNDRRLRTERLKPYALRQDGLFDLHRKHVLLELVKHLRVLGRGQVLNHELEISRA